MSDLVPLHDADFSYVTRLLYERAGIRMGEQKRSLISARLSKRIRTLGFQSFGEYLDYLKAAGGDLEFGKLLDLLTTNHSFFYREKEHYDFLVAKVLVPLRASLAQGGGAELRIWSAGCAAGEEAYSIAMTIRDSLGDDFSRADTGVLATDISATVLNEAMEAVYPAAKLRELPRRFIDSYMVSRGQDLWAIRPELRAMVLFKRLNLMREGFPFKGGFDVVFCRNVMIYFDGESRRRLVASLHKVIKPGGYLFIGHSESIQRDDCPFLYVKPAIYRKEG